jgi:hypothetical protein
METTDLTKNETELLTLLLKKRVDNYDDDRTMEDNLLEYLSKEITILTVLLRKLYRISEDRIPEDSDLMRFLSESKYHRKVNDDDLEELFYMFKYT